jgi:ribosomal protein S18 acetylase RimI-like enzyme
LRRYERNFMVIDRAQATRLAPAGLDGEIQIEPWSHRAQEQAASLIAAAYRGHVDSEINDQYRSVAGARRFLLNIVQYPGCGSFFQPGSFLARRSGTGELVGLALASLVAPLVGHITQVCVSPEAREGGIGRELVQHCLQGLMALGCGAASLTVTAENSRAVNLYRHLGFVKERSFAAYVWENLR